MRDTSTWVLGGRATAHSKEFAISSEWENLRLRESSTWRQEPAYTKEFAINSELRMRDFDLAAGQLPIPRRLIKDNLRMRETSTWRQDNCLYQGDCDKG